MKKSLLVMLMAVLLAAGTLAGCTDPQEKPGEDVSQNEPAEDTPQPELTEEDAPREEAAEQMLTLALPEAFAVHPGDGQYFYPSPDGPNAPFPLETDPEDYSVVMYDAHKSPILSEYVEGRGDVAAYEGYMFGSDEDGNTVFTEYFIKLVYEDESLAQEAVAAQDRDDIYAVGNVAYIANAFGTAIGADKGEILQNIYGYSMEQLGAVVYLSKHEGYEEIAG